MPKPNYNPASAIQQDSVLFKGIQDEIKSLGIMYFAKLSNVSHPTLNHYLLGNPVNPSTETKILKALEQAKADRIAADAAKIEFAKSIIS